MRILILANNDVGLYRFRKELIEQLLLTNEVFISLPYGNLVENLVEKGCQFVDTPIDRRGINPFRDIVTVIAYYRLLSNIKPDLVISYTIKPVIYGGIIAKLLKFKYVANITGLGTVFQTENWLKKMVVMLYKVALSGVSTVFFENTANKEVFVKSNIVPDFKGHVLNGAGVNLDEYPLLPYPTDESETRLLFVGRVMEEKGIVELLEAVTELNSEGLIIKLDIVGGLEENLKPLLLDFEAKGFGMYHGFQQDVQSFIRKSHALILPSWHEGMANTNLEGAASGRPIITSDIPGCREAVVDNKSGYLFGVKNKYMLKEAIRKFINLTVEERKEMGLVAREHIEANFDKESIINETLSYLDLESWF
ncbi:TPA: glycosyltransferase family 4 protein [Streptococcus suis]